MLKEIRRNSHIIFHTIAGVMMIYNLVFVVIRKNDGLIKGELRNLESELVYKTHHEVSSVDRAMIAAKFDNVYKGLSRYDRLFFVSLISAPIFLIISSWIRINRENEKKSQAFKKQQNKSEVIAVNSANKI
mgnify:CR=1 FL=1